MLKNERAAALVVSLLWGAGCLIPVSAGTHRSGLTCTPGEDETCNTDVAMSAIAGRCQEQNQTRACVCNAGYELDDQGLCRTATPESVCTVGEDQTCNDNPAQSSLAGGCVSGSHNTCHCNQGFELNPNTGRCAASAPVSSRCTVGQDQTCNDDVAMSSLAGTCVAGQGNHCQCNAGFEINVYTGRCASSLNYCLVTKGSHCEYTTLSGQTPPAGYCGPFTIDLGCSCTKTNGDYTPLCTGACQPTPDGGVLARCDIQTNCGAVYCGSGTTCTGQHTCM